MYSLLFYFEIFTVLLFKLFFRYFIVVFAYKFLQHHKINRINIIWIIIIIASCISLVFIDPNTILPVMIGASNESLSLAFELLCIYAVWLGILNIVENTKICNGISYVLSPFIDFLWGKKSMNDKAKKYLSLALSTQLFGIGGASVPLGIKAIEEMDDKTGVITFPMVMSIVFACSGVQIIPSTIMSMMISAGSNNPSFVILPTILGGVCTTVVGVVLAIICEKISIKHKKNHTLKIEKKLKIENNKAGKIL